MIPEMKWAWLLLLPFRSFFLEGARQNMAARPQERCLKCRTPLCLTVPCALPTVFKTAGFSYRNRGRALSDLVCQLPQHFSYPRGPGSRHRLCAHSPLLFHSWYKQWKQMSRFSVSFLYLAPSPFPLRLRPPVVALQPSNDRSLSCLFSLYSSHPYSCSLSPTLSPILPRPGCFQSTHFLPSALQFQRQV